LYLSVVPASGADFFLRQSTDATPELVGPEMPDRSD
jgi:hypothetical protein